MKLTNLQLLRKIIDQTPDATEEEKEVAKQKVDEEATKAKDNIDQLQQMMQWIKQNNRKYRDQYSTRSG